MTWSYGNRFRALDDVDREWFERNADRSYRIRPAMTHEARLVCSPRDAQLPHIAVVRRGLYNRIERLVIPSSDELPEMNEERSRMLWQSHDPDPPEW